MKRSVLKKIKSPLITVFFNTPSFFKADIEVLALCASGQLEQASESQRKSALFQSIASNSKVNDPRNAQVLLSYLIEQGHTEYPFEAALREFSKVIHTLDIHLLFETMGLDVLKRLSLMDPRIARVVFTHLCSKLQASTLAWLHAQFTIKHPISDKQQDLSELEAPDLKHPDTPFAQGALHIALHQNQITELSEILYQYYVNQTTETEQNRLDKQIKNFHRESIQSSYREWSDTLINFKPGFYDEALSKIKKIPLSDLKIYYALLVVNELEPLPNIEERHVTEIVSLTSEFNVPAVFQAVKDRLTTLDPECIETTHQHLKDAINRLSPGARAWLFCGLYLGSPEDIDHIGKPWSPLDGEEESCNVLLTLAMSQPSMWSFIYEYLDHTTPVNIKLTTRILAVFYFQNIASQIEKYLGEDGRLWFTLMLETNRPSALFQMQSHRDEYYDNTGIRNPMDQRDSAYFLKQANASLELRKLLLAVFKNHSESQDFKTKLQSISHYIHYHIDTSIQALIPNDKVWLYLALLLQLRLQSPLKAAGFQIVPPKGESHKKIQIILQELYLNPSIKNAYLERLYLSLDSQQQAFVDNLAMNYAKQIVAKSDDNECRWILISMLSRAEPVHEIIPGKTISYAQERALSVARLLSIANYKPEIWSALPNLLKERLPSIESDVYSTHYGLGDSVQQLSTASQLASDYLTSVELAEKGLRLLLPKLDRADIAWLKTTLNADNINYRTHGANTFDQEYNEPNGHSAPLLVILLLILKYPVIRKKCAELLECDTTHFPEYLNIILDGITLEDRGFRALSDVLITRKLRLRVLSLCETKLRNPDFESFSPILENRGVVYLKITDNDLSNRSLRQLIEIGDTHPDTRDTLIPTVLSLIHDPFSWAALQIGVQSKRSASDFYFSEPYDFNLVKKMQTWLENERYTVTRMSMVAQELPEYFKDFQRCHVALSRNDTQLSKQLFFSLFQSIEPTYQKKLRRMCSGTLSLEPSLALSKRRLAHQQEAFYNYCLVFCLFTHLRAYTPEWLKVFFRVENLNSNLETLHLQTDWLTEELMNLLTHTLSFCPEVGKSLEIEGEWNPEHARLLNDFCPQLQNLTLSNTPLSESSIRTLSPLIQRNDLLSLTLKNSTFQENGLHSLLERLQESSILSLSLSHANEGISPLAFAQLFELSTFLKDPFCPLQRLELEGYQLPKHAYKTLVTALKSNKDSSLRELSLNGTCTESAQADALAQLAALPTLEALLCNDHCCTAKQLLDIYQSVKCNLNLRFVELRPSDEHLNRLSGEERDECARLLEKIESLVLQRRLHSFKQEQSCSALSQSASALLTTQFKAFKEKTKSQEVSDKDQHEQAPRTLSKSM